MKGKGRPKKGCAKKLNFNKVKDKSNIDDLPQDSTICNKEEISLKMVTENDDIESDVIPIRILPENSIEHVASTSGSDINNNFVRWTIVC